MRLLSIALLISITTFTVTAQAVEPEAPQALMSPEEAMIIKLRQRLAGFRDNKRPTQTEKGEAIDRKGLQQFYTAHGHSPLWVNADGLNERAQKAALEISRATEWGLDPEAFQLPSDPMDTGEAGLTTTQRVDLELKMSLAVLKYARHARGGRMDPKDLSLDIDRTPPLLPADKVLLGAAEADNAGDFLRGLHPKHEQFRKLRAAYLEALEAEAEGRENSFDIAEARTNKRKKRRKSRKKTPLSKRILYNMEMWRWMPEELGSTHVWANIPEYRIRVIKHAKIIHSERMITGKVKNKTPVFSDELETIVFHPFWGVPNSIKVKELLPKLMRGGTLSRQGLRIKRGGRDVNPLSVDWSRADIRNYHVYQPPGSRNALGIVKFMFPNKHAVYFHDTPSKYLFKKKTRAYSHGCLRIRDPLKMAEVLFGEDRGWNRSKINDIVRNGGENNEIALNTKFPVHVTYFTVRVDEDGELKLVRDIYGHEARIQKGLDGKAHTIVKENRNLDKYLASRPSRPSRRYSRFANSGQASNYFFQNFNSGPARRPSGDNSWKNQVWGN